MGWLQQMPGLANEQAIKTVLDIMFWKIFREAQLSSDQK